MSRLEDHLIDCHVLTLPSSHPLWADELRKDLDAEPVNQHWLPGIEGRLADARAAGFSAGCAPFVSYADPDDRIMPGTYATLLRALQENPMAPFAWVGEERVNEELQSLVPFGRGRIYPFGYSPILHLSRNLHIHGVKLYRREFVMPHLQMMRQVGQCCEFLLDMVIVKPYTDPPMSGWPIHVPVVGRLWRQHGNNTHPKTAEEDLNRMAQMLGFDSTWALRETAMAIKCPIAIERANAANPFMAVRVLGGVRPWR